MFKKILARIAKIASAMQEAQQRKAEFVILSSLTDRDLKDIGLTRGEIRHRLQTK